MKVSTLFCSSLTRWGNEFTWHSRGLEKCREDSGKLYNHFNSFIASKVTFCSLSCQFFMKVTMRGKISLVEVMTKQRKTMRKCPQQTL